MTAIRIRYQTIEFNGFDIHLRTLLDKQQFADQLGEAESFGISSAQWPLFGVIWDSSKVLAHEMLEFDIAGKRILELDVVWPCPVCYSTHAMPTSLQPTITRKLAVFLLKM